MWRYQEFLDHVAEIDAYNRIWKRLDFERQCCTPKTGLTCCADDISLISRKLHELKCEPAYVKIMEELLRDSSLTPIESISVKYHYELYLKEKNISSDFAQELSAVTGAAFDAWMRARKANDYLIFRPFLNNVIEMVKKRNLNRETPCQNLYDGCLSDFERDFCVKKADEFFDALKSELCPMLSKITQDLFEEDPLFSQHIPIETQKSIALLLLEAEGVDLDQTFFIETEHPFTQSVCQGDLRVTTHYYENDFISNIYTVMHEGGHAILHLNLPESFYENGLSEIPTYGMHECISRFYENIIGRSYAFCEWITPIIQKHIPGTFRDLTAKRLYKYVNRCQKQPIRMEADEWSYCIHILIRYELEKAFINDNLPVEDIPRLWNEKYRQYLGIDVQNDNEGVLQDVHWVDCIGYFPSYALGTVAGAQLFYRMNEDFDVYHAVRTGKMIKIKEWLHKYAFVNSMTSNIDTWIESVTGQKFSTEHFIRYMKEKCSLQ